MGAGQWEGKFKIHEKFKIVPPLVGRQWHPRLGKPQLAPRATKCPKENTQREMAVRTFCAEKERSHGRERVDRPREREKYPSRSGANQKNNQRNSGTLGRKRKKQFGGIHWRTCWKQTWAIQRNVFTRANKEGASARSAFSPERKSKKEWHIRVRKGTRRGAW